jgi:pimeloyl-ACP methyl ester carboxylesterase
MHRHLRLSARTLAIGAAAWLAVGLVSSANAQPSNGRGFPGFGQGGIPFAESNDPRVQNRTYHFADTNEDLPYCVFVSSKVSARRKAPLIVSLHGLGIGPGFMCQGKAIDLAEAGGYILVAPIGYSVGGWYGSPVITFGPGRGPGGRGGEGAGRGRGGRGGDGRGGAAPPLPASTQPPEKVRDYSEKDVLNVLAMIRDEFRIDDKRTYLMGHSMGGAGTYFLGSKYADQWAAIAPIAPAAFLMNDNRADILQGIRDADLPMLVAQGDADEAVPVDNTRMWVATMKDMGMDFEYIEYPGVMHGPIIEASMDDIFRFFAQHKQ